MDMEIDVTINDDRVRLYKDRDTRMLQAFCNLTFSLGDAKLITINNCRIVKKDGDVFLGFPESEPYVDRDGKEKRTKYIWIANPELLPSINGEAKRALQNAIRLEDEAALQGETQPIGTPARERSGGVVRANRDDGF